MKKYCQLEGRKHRYITRGERIRFFSVLMVKNSFVLWDIMLCSPLNAAYHTHLSIFSKIFIVSKHAYFKRIAIILLHMHAVNGLPKCPSTVTYIFLYFTQLFHSMMTQF
jgi:hypothetical protein